MLLLCFRMSYQFSWNDIIAVLTASAADNFRFSCIIFKTAGNISGGIKSCPRFVLVLHSDIFMVPNSLSFYLKGLDCYSFGLVTFFCIITRKTGNLPKDIGSWSQSVIMLSLCFSYIHLTIFNLFHLFFSLSPNFLFQVLPNIVCENCFHVA